jgi:hypothetical protein
MVRPPFSSPAFPKDLRTCRNRLLCAPNIGCTLTLNSSSHWQSVNADAGHAADRACTRRRALEHLSLMTEQVSRKGRNLGG